MTTWNPCLGVERNQEDARKNVLSAATSSALLGSANVALPLMGELALVTAMRKPDIRNLQLSRVGPTSIKVVLNKSRRTTRKELEFTITPEVRRILEAAAKLPGRARSLYVFPTRRGTPYTESALQSAMRRARKKSRVASAVFKDFRTTALNEQKQKGGDASEMAGHADRRTTERHYLDVPTKVEPLR